MPEKTIEELEEDLKSEHGLHLRALADFDNYRRRIERDRAQFGMEALKSFMIGLLDVMDDLERFLDLAREETSPFIDGIRLVHRKLLALLEMEGAHPFDSVGKPFDPALHEVAGTQPANEQNEGIVIAEARRGYMFRDELLRTARVIVAV
jgi:molecular chaperone GrpE